MKKDKVSNDLAELAEAYAHYVNDNFAQPNTIHLTKTKLKSLIVLGPKAVKNGKVLGLDVVICEKGFWFSREKR